MKKLLMATATAALSVGASAASAEDVTLGIILGFTGPIEIPHPAYGGRSGAGDQRSQRKRQAARWHDGDAGARRF